MADDLADYHGKRFHGADFSGATFQECSLRGVRIIGSLITDMYISGFAGEHDQVLVEDVDVMPYVQAELDRRHPERVQLRATRTADEFRAMWATIEAMWAETIGQTERMEPAAAYTRVADEWSLVETLRHLVFATDVWVGRMVLGAEMPYHRLGLPPTDYPSELAAELGLEVDATPSIAEVLVVRAGRVAQMRELLAGITDDELDEMRTAEPAPGWDEESLTVGRCLRVLMREECEHHRFTARDLAVLNASVGD